jgi:hypothetical protein
MPIEKPEVRAPKPNSEWRPPIICENKFQGPLQVRRNDRLVTIVANQLALIGRKPWKIHRRFGHRLGVAPTFLAELSTKRTSVFLVHFSRLIRASENAHHQINEDDYAVRRHHPKVRIHAGRSWGRLGAQKGPF